MLLRRILLSGFIVFHLLGVLTVPNHESLLYQELSHVYQPYLRFLSLDGSWSFFAPDPNLIDFHVHYELQSPGMPPISGEFPKERSNYRFREAYYRMVSLISLMLPMMGYIQKLSPTEMEQLLATTICKQDPKALKVTLRGESIIHPRLLASEEDKKRLPERDVYSKPLGTYQCNGDAHAQLLQ